MIALPDVHGPVANPHWEIEGVPAGHAMVPWRRCLTTERLREVLHYDPATGVFTWRVSKAPTARNGQEAGCIQKGRGRRVIRVDDTGYPAHRLAWLYMTGEWPAERIGHKDGDSTNNRWENLREATHTQNICNARRRKDNRSGFKGVGFDARRKRWHAKITVNGKARFLGRFGSPKEAHAAYVAAAARFFGEFARAA